jgi:hypothetical protein
MRALVLIAGAALTLAACKNNDQVDNTQNVDENLSAENIVSNDVTAIDAVTGDSANMAADVEVNASGADNAIAPEDNPGAPPSKRNSPPKAMTPPAKPVTNTASDAATNSQ